MARVKVTEEHTIRIPDEVWEQMDTKPGDKVRMLQVGKSLRIVKVRTLEEIQEKLKGLDTSGLREEIEHD